MNYSNITLSEIAIHVVGNKATDDGPALSDAPLELNEEIKTVLTGFFTKPFAKLEGLEKFTHSSQLSYNTCYTIIRQLFHPGNNFHALSIELAQHLFDQSASHFIKQGEFYVVYFKDVVLENKNTDAIGLFKSESREKFLKVFPDNKNYAVEVEEGIDINKLDKGALVINDQEEDGYRLLTIDNTNRNNEAQYWLTNFLGVTPAADSYHTTKDFLSLTKQFITKTMTEEFEVSRTDQADYLNRSVAYFKTQDTFNEKEFVQEVFGHSTVIDSFQQFRDKFARENELPVADNFSISANAVKKQARIFKSIIKLDRNFHIYIHGDKDLIEQGYDEKVGKKYYKIYFDEEN